MMCWDPVEVNHHLTVAESRLELCNHGGNAHLTDSVLLPMLCLPTLVAEKLVETMCTLWDLFIAVSHVYIKDSSQVTEAQCKLICHWTMTASQSSQDSSKLCLSVTPANSPDIGFQ